MWCVEAVAQRFCEHRFAIAQLILLRLLSSQAESVTKRPGSLQVAAVEQQALREGARQPGDPQDNGPGR